MADARIQDLTPATSINSNDRFVLEQSGQAKSLTGSVLLSELYTALDGHGGINNIAYTPPVSPSLNGTLTITTTDGTSYSLVVTNGRGITGLTWESSGTAGDGMTHTGTFAYNDGSTSTVEISDGVKGDTGAQTYVWFRWSQRYPTADTDMQNSVGPYVGIYAGLSQEPPTAYTAYTWYQYKGEKGDAGSNIQSITKTGTSGLVDTYTVTLTDGSTTTFAVTNAKSIVSITSSQGVNPIPGTINTIMVEFNDGDIAQFYVANGANGTGSVSTVSGIQADGNGDVPQILSGTGAPTTATVGQANQLYYDMSTSILYYCAGENATTPGSYDWYGAGVSVDTALSGSSTNPVQNRVITNKLGTATLTTTAQNVSAAINEHETDIGSMSLDTTATDLTGAINEHETDISGINTQIGSTALPTTAQTLTGAISELSGNAKTFPRPNLLDNWYFAGGGDQQGYGHFPINSQGKTSYSKTVAAAIPTFDRWEIAGTGSAPAGAVTVTLTSAGAQITKATDGATWDLYNNIRDTEYLAGKTVTFSALVTELTAATFQLCIEQYNGSYSYTYSDQFTTTGLHSVTATIASDTTRMSVVCILPTGTARTCTVQAVKLEVGPDQTLGYYDGSAWKLREVPDYREQLERCQNYRFRNSGINENILDNWFFAGGGSQENYKYGKFPLNFRGQTTYSSAGYTIDRWTMSSGATLTVNTTSITWNSGQVANYQQFRQYLSKTLIAGTYTISMLAKVNSVNGTVGWGLRDENNHVQNSLAITSATSGYELFTLTFTLDSLKTGWSMCIVTSNATTDNISIDIQGMKLEAGSVQTLAYHNDSSWILREIPDYTEQQHRCWMAKTNDTTDIFSKHPITGMFYEPWEVGQPTGSATVAGVWAAMPSNSAGFFSSSAFTSGQTPGSEWGFIYIVKRSTIGMIIFYRDAATETASNAPQSKFAYMPVTNGTPNGTWYYLNQVMYSPVHPTTITTNTALTVDMIGKTLIIGSNSSESVTLTINSSVVSSIPIGAEIAVFSDMRTAYTATIKFVSIAVANPDIGWRASSSTGLSYTIPKRYSIVTMKKIWDGVMAIYGDIEEVTS